MPFITYILFSPEHSKYYVGQTDDLDYRMVRLNVESENNFTCTIDWGLRIVD